MRKSPGKGPKILKKAKKCKNRGTASTVKRTLVYSMRADREDEASPRSAAAGNVCIE